MNLSWFVQNTKRQALAAFLLGLLAGLPFTFMKYPWPFWIAPVIAFPLFLNLLEYVFTSRKSFLMGWLFGVGFHTAALYWIVMALSVDWAKFAAFVPLSIFGIPAYLGLGTGLVAYITYRFCMSKVTQILCFCLLWAFIDWVRGTLVLPFPWDLLGYIWVHVDPVLQSVGIFGIYGLTLITLLFVCAPAFPDNRLRLPFLLTPVFFFSFYVFENPETVLSKNHIRLIQPNISQQEKWERTERFNHFQRMLTMNKIETDMKRETIIWPEAAADFLLDEAPKAQKLIGDSLPKGALLVTGSVRRQLQPLKIWNSLFAVDSNGKIQAFYDKSKLVPYGEYIPLRRFLPQYVVNVAAGPLDYTHGEGLKTVKVNGFPSFSPLICFEGIFSGEVVAKQGPRPDYLLNLTNDAWYGDTAGPYQHLHITRVRAIEEGLPFVRVANTGVSVVIDSYGRVMQSLGLNKMGILEGKLPLPRPELTLFAQYGHQFFWLLMALLALTTLWSWWRDRWRAIEA